MILISNIGNRDVIYNEERINPNKVRQRSGEILNSYESEKHNLSYPILRPFLDTFTTKIKKIYLFVTNQESEKNRFSDTIFFGEIIKKWIQENYAINVNVIQYVLNPTDYEMIYHFYTSYFIENQSVFNKANNIVVSLSGGTPQMNGALYVILSSLFPKNIEFYSVYKDKLIPINHEITINKIFVKKSSIELLKRFEYQAIITVLNEYNVQGREKIILLLKYAKFRKNFSFEKAMEFLLSYLDSIPSSAHKDYDIYRINSKLTPIELIKELFWNIEISYKTQNYLLLTSLLFRLEEAILNEINNYLFKYFFFKKEVKGGLNNKKIHEEFIKYLEDNEQSLWKKLQNIEFKGQQIEMKKDILDRPVLFYIAKLKIRKIKEEENKYLYQIGNILDIFDRINKYCYSHLRPEERTKKYKDEISTMCLGDLRNISILAHGFEPVSREKIEGLYKENISDFIEDLKKKLTDLLKFLVDDKYLSLENIFNEINLKLQTLINQC